MEKGASFISSIDHTINLMVRILTSTKRPYACNVCKIRFAKLPELVDHVKVHSDRPHRCDRCRKTYPSLVAFREHMNKDHKQVLRYTCPHCFKNYTLYANYYTHLREHECFECDVCFEQFSEYRVLFEHYVRNHVEKVDEKKMEEAKKYLCSLQNQDCPEHPKLKNQIMHDRTTVHSYSRQKYKILAGKHSNKINSIQTETFNTINQDPKNIPSLTNNIANDQSIKCLPSQINIFPKMRSSNKSKSEKQKNKNTKDKGSNPAKLTRASGAKEMKDISTEYIAEVNANACLEKYVKQCKTERISSIDDAVMICKICNKKFPSRKSYWAHVRTHKGEKSYTCHICGKQFIQGGSLYYHLKHVHDGVKNHACDICGRSFAMKTAMEDHRRIHTGERPYVCHTCGKTFKTKASLYIHSKTHTDEFPHKCIYCAKRFRWRQQMLGHLTVHTGEKNHTCDVCGKGFGVKNDLTKHKRIHSEEKPYTCQQCGISFGQKRYLKSHERLRLGMCGYSQEQNQIESD